MAYSGFFKPQNPQKYKGNPTNIIYRSFWEFGYMRRLDKDKDVLEWSSEELAIPYISPIDNRHHRYYPDFLVTRINSKGIKETVLIEIKPYKETMPPGAQGNKKKKQYLYEVMTWGKNEAKWKAARNFCKDRGWKFEILTERELGKK